MSTAGDGATNKVAVLDNYLGSRSSETDGIMADPELRAADRILLPFAAAEK